MPVLRPLAALLCVGAIGIGGSAAYAVQPGDTLSSIASRLGVGPGALARVNGITDPNRIFAGRRLEVPATPAPARTAVTLPQRLRASPQRLALRPTFRRWAGANRIPPELLMATTWLESGWQTRIVSRKGAVGIGQLMPATTRFIAGDLIGRDDLDPRVPEDNIRMSARYLRWLLVQAGGDVRLALGGYYQGPRSVRVSGPFPATIAYVDGVLALRGAFRS